jgi:hypothetical protein
MSLEHDPARALRFSGKFLTRRQLVTFLNEHGYPTSLSTLAKLSMPSRGEGPPCEGMWGNRSLYDPIKALEWAQARFRAAPRNVA